MSLWSLLTATAVLPTDLVTAGIVASTAQVVAGRRPQDKTDQRGEVWLERLPGSPEGTGLQHVTTCPIRVHYRTARGNAGGNRAGNAQLVEVEAKLAAIVARYRSSLRFVAVSGLTDSLPSSAVEGQVDEDPEDEAVLSGYVDLTFRLKE